ncbi:MAG: hypothetical protein WCH43_14805, partial [Verrucomicrobiota bacterium]
MAAHVTSALGVSVCDSERTAPIVDHSTVRDVIASRKLARHPESSQRHIAAAAGIEYSAFSKWLCLAQDHLSDAAAEPAPETIALTFASSERSTDWADRRSITWAELTTILTDHSPGQKAGSCFAPATFRGQRRLASDASRIDVLVLDLDDGARSLGEIKNAVEGKGWRAIIYTTHSHSADCPKFRLVLALARPWQSADYPSQAEACAAWKLAYINTASALGVAADLA